VLKKEISRVAEAFNAIKCSNQKEEFSTSEIYFAVNVYFINKKLSSQSHRLLVT